LIFDGTGEVQEDDSGQVISTLLSGEVKKQQGLISPLALRTDSRQSGGFSLLT